MLLFFGASCSKYHTCGSFHCSQVSTNILRKYIGPLDIWFSILDAMQHSGEVMHCLLNEHPQKSFLAMAQHSSQWVWYVFILVFSPEEGNLFCHEMFSTKVISVYLFPFSNVLPCFKLISSSIIKYPDL